MSAEPKYLSVDDFGTLCRIVRNPPKELGRQNADEVEDGGAALKNLRGDGVYFVASAVNMPNINGFDLLRAIRADEALRRLSIPLMMAAAAILTKAA